MRRELLLCAALLLAIASFGCIEQKEYSSTASEKIESSRSVDIDKDGLDDYSVYVFAPVTIEGTGMTVQRHVSVAARSSATFTYINPNLTDVDLLAAGESIGEFSKSRDQASSSCSQAIGLFNVVCSDTATCSKLCASNSVRCKKIAASYEDVLAGSMISYIQDVNQLGSLTVDASRMVTGLRTGTPEERDAFLAKTRSIIDGVSEIDSNPLYTNPDLSLCTASDFGISYITDSLSKIGTYTTENSGYHYTVMVSVKPVGGDGKALSDQVGALAITDAVPKSMIGNKDAVSTVQTVSSTESGDKIVLAFSEAKPTEGGRIFIYEFDSDSPPSALIGSLTSPALSIKRINLVWLAPVNFIFGSIYALSNNYFLALGLALGLTLAALFLLYNIGILVFSVLSEKTAGSNFSTAFRKAFGRTDIKWKTDLALAVIALVAGYYVSGFMAPQAAPGSSLVQALDLLLGNGIGMVGTFLAMVGAILLYFAVENIVKITLIEMSYGKILKAEKDAFGVKADAVKAKIKILSDLIEAYREEEFDISREYDVLTSISPMKIDELARNMTPRTRTMLDDYMLHIEGAITTLRERKKVADESWPRWKDSITRSLEEHDEVYASNLVTVPSSLRLWALSKYVKEKKSEGIVFERDAVRKKKIDPTAVVKDLIGRKLIRGAIVIAEEKVSIAEFADGNTTLRSALAMKLRTYVHSLAKNLAQHEPSRFLAVGESSVMVCIKGRVSETVLFLDKDKVKEAIEAWNNKMAPNE